MGLNAIWLVKVSKSQKQLKLHCPKNKILDKILPYEARGEFCPTNKILDKILPYEARGEFCQIFLSFFRQWSFKKKCFWILLTFNAVSLLFYHWSHVFTKKATNFYRIIGPGRLFFLSRLYIKELNSSIFCRSA